METVSNCKVDTKLFITLDRLTAEIVHITDSFFDCKENLETLPDGEYSVSSWIYTNNLKYEPNLETEYLIRNGLVYKLKYTQQSDNFID